MGGLGFEIIRSGLILKLLNYIDNYILKTGFKTCNWRFFVQNFSANVLDKSYSFYTENVQF
jgi:hypothetical protein